MEEFNYKPKGTCSTNIKLLIDKDTLYDIEVTNGCPGNLEGIRSLVKGMKLTDIALKLEGIDCRGRGTSCPDQIATAIKEYLGALVK